LLKGFGNFLVKELKELIRDPKILLGMIILPLIMFPVIGGIMNYSIQSAQEQAQKTPLLVLNNDGENWSETFINFLNPWMNVFVINNTTPEEAIAQGLLSRYNTTQFIEIPSGFSANLTAHNEGNTNITSSVDFYGVFSGAGLFESVGSSVIDNLIYSFNRDQAPDFVETTKSSIIKGNITKNVDPSTLSGLMISQSIALPITIMILLTYSMQIAATSVAMEKEEKTLETLLTLPMDRLAILMGKLSSSILVAGVGALAYMIGYNFMLGSFTASISTGTSIDLASLGLVPSLFGYLLLGISLFVALLSALALAVIISAFSEDVRSAQSLIGYIYPLIFIPSFALMYLDVNTLPFALKIVMYAIPYSHPIIASKAVIMGDYWTAILGIIYVTVFTIVVMYAASRLFATEKILTAKLKFRLLRKRSKKPTEELQ
jgi:ABC-2 type transport system permease protein